MMNKLLGILIASCFSVQVYAFPCFFTVAKDRCWGTYNVTVTAFDAANDKQITSVVIAEGISWQRQKFECNPKQKLRFQAEFTPVFWQSDTGKIYAGLNFWNLPNQVASGDTAWTITLCYPGDFAEVPFPPEGDSKCKCDVSAIPAITPQ